MDYKNSLTLAVISSVLFLGACSDSADTTDPGSKDSTYIYISQKAFNKFDTTTFSESTCINLPLEIPSGIFVSLNGSSSSSGTQDDPLDLETVLSSSSPAQPGDTIWIKEGVYKGSFTSKISGSAGHPISIKPLPGQRVLINSHNSGIHDAGLRVNGQWTDFYNIEATSSDTYRGNTYEQKPGVEAKSGIAVFGAHTNIFNCITHDNIGGGIDFWKTARDSTLHGNIIYNNGFAHAGRGASHGVYTQNTNGYKKLTNNIVFFGFQTGFHPYSTKTAPLNNFTIENNVWFLAGASDPRDNQQKTNLIVETQAGIKDMVIKNNKGYSQVNRGSSIHARNFKGNVEVRDNYLVERLEVYGDWDPINFTNNTIYGNITDPNNSLLPNISNTLSTSRPAIGNKVFVDANGIDPRRGRVTIYNYDNADSVNVDLSSILKDGEAYRIHSVMGLFQEALLSSVYHIGDVVSIPMGTIDPPQPNGNPNGIDEDDGPKKKFGVFIVTHGGCQ